MPHRSPPVEAGRSRPRIRPLVAVAAVAQNLRQAEPEEAAAVVAASGRSRLREVVVGAVAAAVVRQTLEASSKLRMIHACMASE